MTNNPIFKPEDKRITRSIVIQTKLNSKLKELAKSERMSVSRITERIIENFFTNESNN